MNRNRRLWTPAEDKILIDAAPKVPKVDGRTYAAIIARRLYLGLAPGKYHKSNRAKEGQHSDS